MFAVGNNKICTRKSDVPYREQQRKTGKKRQTIIPTVLSKYNQTERKQKKQLYVQVSKIFFTELALPKSCLLQLKLAWWDPHCSIANAAEITI